MHCSGRCYNKLDVSQIPIKPMLESMTINQARPANFEALTTFRSKLQSKSVQIGVNGSGYVGLPLGLRSG
jgi:hypothetical protein